MLTRPLLFVAVMLALLVSAGAAHAQGTPTVPSIESVAVTSDPGEDGGYAIGDEIQVALTFSEAVTVTGAPQLTLDLGGRRRTAEYSEGSSTTRLLFTYTVAAGDEDTDGIAVVANSLALNGGAIRAGATNATLTHAALQANDHRVDGIAPTVTVGGETRTYVPPDRQFNVVFYFSEKVYGITDAEITVTNGEAHDVRATSGNDTWPRYTRWDVIIVSAAEGPVTVTLEAGAATDAYGNGNTAPDSALSVIAANPVSVEVTRTNSGFAEGGKAAFIVTRSRDNGAIPVSLSLDQTGDFLSGAVEVYPPPDPDMPENPVTPTEVEFTETPFTLNVTFAAGETSKRIAALTEDDYRVENDGTVTLSVPARPDQYKYIPGYASSASADVRNNDVSATVSLYWSRPFNPYTTTTLDTVQEGSSILLGVYGRAIGQPLLVTLAVTEVGSYLDLDGEGARGYEDLGNGKLRVTLPVGSSFENVVIPLLDNGLREADGSVTITVEADPGMSYIPSVGSGALTIPVKDNDAPSTVSISEPDDLTEGTQLTHTLTRTWAPGQSQAELTVNVRLEQTGDYITWPSAHQPDADGLVTIPVTFAARSLTGTLTLDTVDDEVSEDNGSVTATILAGANGKYVAGTSSAVTTTLLDNDPPIISVEAVAAEVDEGDNAQYRITRSGNTSGSLRVGLYVTGLPKIMTDATETIVLTSDNEDQTKRLTINGPWVDYILEFAAGETEKTLPLTTEADSINEGDGWLGVSILQRIGVPYSVGTGRAQVLVKDDDIPTVSLIRPVGPTGLTLSSDGTTWEGKIVEGTQFTYSSTCTGVTEFSGDAGVNLDPVSMWVQYSNHPAFYAERDQNNTLGYNRAGIHHLGTDCGSQTVTYRDYRFYVGPENGVLEIEIVPRSELVKQGGGSSRYRPRLFAELARQYEAAAAEAQAAGTLITKKNIFHPASLTGYHPDFACNESDLRYCPQYRAGTVNKIRLTVTNRDPTILIKAESTSVTEGQPARFILERRWATDLLALPPPQSETVVYLRASQDGQYITGALPTQITFGQNETRKVIEFQTVDDSAFGDSGSVTIELLPDTSTGSENLHGMYSVSENWVGHTSAGGRSDRATVTITNDDDKPGITIAPASATEGDSGNTNVTFTLTLGQAVSGAVAVNYATSDGTATAGQDYTAVTSGAATIPANSTSATFTVSVTGDTTDEPNETFNVTISLPEPDPDMSDGSGSSPPDVAIVGGDTATVSGTIVDDDPVVVTVASRADSVVEGQDAVFVLTRTGYTDDALSMQVRLSAPGKVETLSAEFEAGAATTELSVETEDNDLVDYPSARDYTIEALGDGDINGGDDEIYTPGDPSQATVSVTDNDKLQIITVHPHEAFVREGGEVKYVFRRTGDVSEELRFTYVRTERQAESTGYLDYNFVNERFPAGVSEITTGALVNGGVSPDDEDVNSLFPYKFTAQVYGDGHRYGVHRIWKAGTPDTATVAYYDDDRTRDTVLRAEYPGLAQVGQTIHIDFEVLNTGSEATGNTITVSSVQRASGDSGQPKPAEPRAGCIISGSLATGEIGTCQATFTLTAQDLTDSPMVLDATASDGTTTSSALRIYITVLGGVAVGFNETARLSVTEPANGAANAQAVLAVTRVGESEQQVQVAYTLEPIHTQNRPYPAEEGADYVDNSATPGILTFAANETEKNITIDILGDEIDEQREQFRVTLVPPEGVLVEAAKRSRVVAIVNRDPPSGESYLPTASLELVSADPTPESAGSVDFAVVLDRVWGEDARFEVELDAHDNLTATPAFSRLRQTGDFEAPDGLIHATIPAGQTRFEFSLTLYDDDVREEDETFKMLMGSSITKYLRLIGDEDEVLVTIADDDFVEPTGIELDLTSNNVVFESVAENSSQHDITVTASFSDIRWPTDAADDALRPADPRDVDTTVRVEFDSATSTAARTDIERFRVADSQGAFQNVESFDIVIPAGQTSGTTTLRFKPVNDDVDEEDETATLQGTEVVAADSNEFLPVSSASFTITDDDTRGITLSPASLATGSGIGLMEGGTKTYSLVLDTQPTDTVTVTVATEQGNLIRLTPETLTFTPSNWSTTQTISVVSLDDGTDASFTDASIVHRVSGGDYGSVSVGDIWLLIENTTQAYIYLDDAQASESDGHVEFTVSVRPILRTVPVVVRYTTVDGTAAAGTDYTRQVNTGQTYKIFSIPANGGAGTIRIPITDNEVYGPAKKTFTLQLTNQNNKALLDGGATSLTATGSIIDDDPKPEVSVAGPAGDLSYVSEDLKGPVTFTLTLTGRSAADVTVDYATGQPQVLSGLAARQGITSATAGEDYTAATGTVTFSPGDATKQVTVQLTDDDVSEDTEFFGFKISNVQNAQLRNEATDEVADVGLLDDDARGVAIDPTSVSLEEPAPGETAVASSYTVKLNSKPTDTVTVTIGGANPAVSLSGATLSNTNTLTFTTSNWDTAQTVTVTPVEDANGIAETITLTHIQSGGDYTGIAVDSVTVNVTDSDTRNVVLSPTSLTVTEGDDTGVSYTVKLSTQPSDTITVTIGGHSGTDLSISGTTLSNSNTLTFSTSNWNTAQTVTVKAGHDGNSGDESETLTHTASGGDYANVAKDLPVNVTDDAPATVAVSFGAASYSVAEGSTVTVKVTLSDDPEMDLTIPISKTDQGGASAADYSGVPPSVAFDSGETSKTFVFTAAHDTVDDDGESVKLSFGASLPAGVSAGTTDEATVSITDDDVPSVAVSFGSASYSVAEGSSRTVTLTLSADPERTVVIPIEKTDQGGATTADYSGVPPSVAFDSGETSKSFTFTAAHDTVDDDGESVKLSFGASLPAGVSAGSLDETTVSITDDDAPATVAVSFGAASYLVPEGSSRTVTVTLDEDPERTVVIPIEAANEGGASDSDYSGVPESVTFNAGDTLKSFDVSAVEDNLSESGEMVRLSFGTLPADASAGTPGEAAVSIYDRTQGQNLPTSPTVHFENAAYSVDEGAAVAVKVKLSKAPGSETVIPITAASRAGASDDDYSGVPDSLTFAATDTEKTITLAATDDSVDDDDERVRLSFGSLPGGITATAGEAAEAVVTIADNDKPTALKVEFGQAAYTAAEGSTVTVKVTLSDDPEMDLTIPISKTDQGGASAADYSGVPPSVAFDSGETSKTFVFTAAHDTVDDDGESVKLSFGASLPAGVSAGTTDEATVSITDDDVPSVAVSFGSAAYTVAESDDSGTTGVTENTVEVTLTLSADPERTVVIPIEKTDQGGATTADYSGVPPSVAFDSGETSKSFTLTAAHDTVDDDGESVKLSFGASLPAGVSAGSLDETTVSITDDDAPATVAVSFGAASYLVPEGSSRTVTVTLDEDPERTVVIPIEAANEGGASDSDYSGVPENVTFDAGDTSKTFDVTAVKDTVDDHGESVRLSFDTMPDARVSKGSPSEAMVTIRQDSTPSTADCNSGIWCADLEFRSESPPGEMWFLGSKFLDSQFHYGGVTYRFGHMSVGPYGHNIPIGGQPSPPFAIPERTKFYFSLDNMNASGYDLDRFRVPNDDWMDWTLHISTTKNGETLTAVLPLSEGRFGGGQSEWRWYGSDLEALRAAWTEGQVYKLKIVEDPRSQRTPKVLGPPLYLKVTPYNHHTLGAWWKMPENRVDRAPPNTTYKVQWKEASDSWDNPADVSEETDSPSPATKETLSHTIRGLTGGVEYHVRVIATNTVGDSEPSEVVSGTPTPLPAAGQNIADNSPAKGAPSIDGTPEVGQTLSAVTTDITDDDGLQDVVFSYQWLADDVEISGADGATYILTSDDLGKAINVRVDFTDNAGNEESATSSPTAAVTAAEDLELQSATVDDSTLTLTYNETLDTGVTLPASAFAVNVNEASRSIMGAGVGGSSVLLLLSPAVETGDTVTVEYTAPDGQGFIRDTQGRKAESFSGQAVTNNTASSGTSKTVPPQAPGAPNSLKVSREGSGKLMATWAAPDSGSDPTGYTLQWREAGDGWETQDSVSQADVKGTSHLITGLTDGVEYAVRVIASRDDSESAPSGEVTATPRETTPPSPLSVSVNGAKLTVTFDEALAEVQAPASTAFAVTVAGNNRGVSAVAVSGSAVILTLATAVAEGDAVAVDYTAPTGESAARLQDLAGNAAATFSGLDAGNDTQAADQLTASAHDVPGSHDGSTVFTFELRFSENFYLSYKTLRDHAFTVAGGEVTGARRLAPPSNIGWEIQVEPDGDGAATIVLPVTADCTAEGAICTEEGRMLSGGLLLVVPGPNTLATGAPTISGTAQVGETLAADTTGIADDDGLDSVAFYYQWLAADAEINGATAPTYILVADDEGKAIKVRVSLTDDAGNDEILFSAATTAVAAAPPPPNTPATGLPTITGTAQVGETLAANTTGIEDADGLDNVTFTYQWLADDAEINGATAPTYILVAADEGKAIKVRVSLTDDAGNDEELSSAATGAVATAPPPPNTPATGLPTITGTAQVGETLAADTTGIEDADGLDNVTFTYQWLADDAEINGATARTYILVAADEGKAIKVQVSLTDDAGNDEELSSAATGAVATAPPPPNTPATGLPTITGTAQLGETLAADTTGIEDADGLDNVTFTYQWLADDAEINRATARTYILVADDEGKAIKVQVSLTDDAGNDEILFSAATTAVAAAPPPPNTPATGLPTITGTAQVGETLAANTTGIEDADGLDNVTFTYQWLADDAEINGATARTYILVADDEGKAIKVQVSLTDDAGNDEELTSAATTAVAAAPPPPNTPATGLPTITGTAQVGDTLTAVTTGIEDADGLDNVIFSYQWIRNDGSTDTDIQDAMGSSYTLVDADAGKTIKVKVSFTDDAGHEETLSSTATASVEARPNSPATGAPTISGTVQVRETLTASTSGIADTDGLTNVSYSYQWIRNDGSADTVIQDATGSSYTLVDADEGKTIKVKVSFTDDAGNEETLTSAASASVAGAPEPITVILENNPASHNGTDEFTFQIRFSEHFKLSYKTLRDHAFAVVGGTVKKAQRQVKGSNIGWTITVEPASNAHVEIVLPATTDCGATGAICTADGRKLSNSLDFTVVGPRE